MNNLSRRDFVTQSLGAAGALAWANRAAAAEAAATFNPAGERPNILYVILEDINPALACYGQPLVRTPHLDQFAAEGVRFSSAFCTAPVCSASRSAIFTGCYQTSIGCHNHRTWDWNKRPLPAPVRHLCDWYRQAGYYTCNLHPSAAQMGRTKPALFGELGNGKIDLNMVIEQPAPGDPFDGRDWNQRKPGQPFFAHVTLFETHKGGGWTAARRQPKAELVDPAKVTLPPYWPDDPIARDEYANYLDVIHLTDRNFGRLMERLKREGLADNTLVVVGSDHGALFRGKQFLYDDGMHVPLIMRFPGGQRRGTVDDRLVSSVDLAPTMLGMAGIRPPAGAMQGGDLFDPHVAPRECVYAARDRMDIAVDRMRAVRTRRYKYIRNQLPAVPYQQANPYKERFYPGERAGLRRPRRPHDDRSRSGRRRLGLCGLSPSAAGRTQYDRSGDHQSMDQPADGRPKAADGYA
jgi:N-sulfoglucosamine sulfohydrolase